MTLYVLHEGVFVSYILGAPGFVNAGSLELFPDGLPPITPLIATSNGPPSADPFADLEDGGRQPWPECLRGDIAEGFSLVCPQGGQRRGAGGLCAKRGHHRPLRPERG